MIEKNIKNTKLHVGVVALKSARHKGITLMALIITIVIMLILATVTIGAINGGLFSYAGKAKTSAEETSTIEGIQKAYILAQTTSKTNKVKEEDLQKQIDQMLVDQDAIVAKEEDTFIVQIGDKYYVVESNGKVTGPKVFEKLEYAGDITKGGTCTGTQANPYRIECIEDLVKLAELANSKSNIITASKYYLLTKDLDFNSIFSYGNYKTKYSYNAEKKAYIPDENSKTTIKELCTTGKGFIPIGLDYSSGRTLRGIFEGNNHYIKNIYINTSNNAALFGGTNGSTIKDLTIDGDITCTSGKNATGFIADGWGDKIINCCNRAKVTNSGTGNASGFWGIGSDSAITKCINDGEIISENGQAYGISCVHVTIRSCQNKASVTGKRHYCRNMPEEDGEVLQEL